MSTRANIIIKDGDEKLFFYRHDNGYPSGALPTLYTFIEWVLAGKIRDNVMQAAGWLIVLGAIEYQALPKYKTEDILDEDDNVLRKRFVPGSIEPPEYWKVGAIQPTTCIHYDIAYLYTIDLQTKKIKVQKAHYNAKTEKQFFREVKDPSSVTS